MKKTVSTLILLALSLFMITSCSAAYTIGDAQKRTNESKNFEIDGTIEIAVSVSGIELKVPIVVNAKYKGLGTDDSASLEKMTIDFMGKKSETTEFREGDKIYNDTDGVKTKRTATEEELSNLSIAFIIPEELVKSGSYTENDDGSRTFELAISEEEYEKYLSDDGTIGTISEVFSGIAGGDTDYSLHNIHFSAKISKDGYITNQRLSFDASFLFDLQGSKKEMSGSAKIDLSFKNYGTTDFEKPDLIGYADQKTA